MCSSDSSWFRLDLSYMLMHFMAYLTPVDLCVATLTTEEAPRPIVFWTSRSAYLMPEKLFTLSGISTPGVWGAVEKEQMCTTLG